jgi:hypothetical protein
MENPTKLSLDSYITSTAPMLVPRFQRPYAWTSDEIADFLDDLEKTVKRRRAISDENRDTDIHFFGGILSTQFSKPETTPTYFNEVVDGQQRIATVMLSLVALKKRLLQIAAELNTVASEQEKVARGLAENIEKRYLTFEHTDLHTGVTERRQSLRLSEIDREFFQAIISGSEPTAGKSAPPSHKRLRAAYRDLDAYFSLTVFSSDSLTAEERLLELKEAMLTLTKNFYVIKLFTQADRREAFRLFMVLNDRGVSLSDAELLRTRSLELLQRDAFREEQAEVARLWDQMFESSDIAAFLSAYFASRTGVRAPRRDLYDAYLTHVFPESDECSDKSSARAFRDLIAELQSEHISFTAISTGDWPYRSPRATFWEQRRLERLVGVLGRKGDIPLLLAARAAYPADDRIFSRFVQHLEHFGLRWYAANMHSGTLSEAYFEYAYRLRSDPSGFSVERFASELSSFVASHIPLEVFDAGLRRRLRYGTASTNRVIKHVLTTVEDYWKSLNESATTAFPQIRPEKDSAYDLSQVQIEHVYPQEPQADERIDVLDAVVHDLGNLTFLSAADNIEASNKPFRLKRIEYSRAASRMTLAIGQESDWSPESVAARKNELIEYVKRIYELPNEGITYSSPPSFWLFLQKRTENPYDDRPGIEYVYKKSLPNGKQVAEGDFFAVLELKKGKGGAVRGVTAIGRIGKIIDDDGYRRAIFSHYLSLHEPCLISLENDPRLNRQHSMNRISEKVLINYLPSGVSLEKLPAITNT